MLRKFIIDDLKAAFFRFIPLALTLLAAGVLSAFCIGRLDGEMDVSAAKAVGFLEAVCALCQKLLLVSAFPAVLLRALDTLTGEGAVFWAGIPARPWKHIVSKSTAAFLLYLLSAVMYGMVKLVYVRSASDGLYAKSAFYSISSEPSVFLRSTVLAGAIVLFSMLCAQKIILGAAIFCLPVPSRRASTWLVSATAVTVMAGAYVAGYAAVSRISIFSLSERSADMLTYSYSCAFFGVMSAVLTVADTLLLAKRAEY